MDEELVPPDFLLDPYMFESVFFLKEGYAHLKQTALDGQLGNFHNRFLCWKIFLGILPENAPIEN